MTDMYLSATRTCSSRARTLLLHSVCEWWNSRAVHASNIRRRTTLSCEEWTPNRRSGRSKWDRQAQYSKGSPAGLPFERSERRRCHLHPVLFAKALGNVQIGPVAESFPRPLLGVGCYAGAVFFDRPRHFLKQDARL